MNNDQGQDKQVMWTEPEFDRYHALHHAYDSLKRNDALWLRDTNHVSYHINRMRNYTYPVYEVICSDLTSQFIYGDVSMTHWLMKFYQVK